MQIETLVLGILDTNCYIISIGNKCLIIDPADNTQLIKEKCNDYIVEGILVTHHHFDHIGALEELENYYGVKHNTHNNSFDYVVINTPGHTDDSVTFYFENENIMFTGDFIFYNTIGRYDFENSNIKDMKNSLKEISKYDDNIKIYPGHGISTVLGEEKKRFNMYI